ncbi:MAG: LysM peptidoglycan-binding domain-containing protein [Candidatus Promineifilaceae bacterium]
MKRIIFFLSVAAFIILALALQPAQAQTEPPTPTLVPEGDSDIPLVHVVQDGETLTSIAEQYNTTVEVLQQLNNISDPELVFAGQELIVPGGGGSAVAVVHTVQVGDTLQGIAAEYNTTIQAVAEANHLVNPSYLVGGQRLTVYSRTGSADAQPLTGVPYVVGTGDTLLTIAAQYNQSPEAIIAANDLSKPTYLVPGQRLRIPGDGRYQFLPGKWKTVQIHSLPAIQGQTLAIYVENQDSGQPSGEFLGQSLLFSPSGSNNGYVALVGIDAFTTPGDYPLLLGGSGQQPWRPFRQDIRIGSGNYEAQYITVPEDQNALLNPEVRAQDDALLATVYNQYSEMQLWQGLFQLPISNTVITAGYGGPRSYNGGPIEIYHTGVDFSGVVGTPIYAPADGRVVFSDTTTLRGHVLIIDHGLGVMSGFYHLSKIHVSVGEMVSAGQLVADGGSTGLSTGPHLHWDLRILNVPVNPLQWTEEPFP